MLNAGVGWIKLGTSSGFTPPFVQPMYMYGLELCITSSVYAHLMTSASELQVTAPPTCCAVHVPNQHSAVMGAGQSRTREGYNFDPDWRRRESKDQPIHVKRTEARNVMFGVLELARYPLALKRTPRDPVPCAPEYCEQLLEVTISSHWN